MKVININKQIGVKHKLYPDNQPHVNVANANIAEGEWVRVICSITHVLDLMHLLQTSDAIDRVRGIKKELHIPYLMGARFDRVMEPGDSFDLSVISKIINMCGFMKVFLYDAHSYVAPALIENTTGITNQFLVEKYPVPNSVLIVPDGGAAHKAESYFNWNPNIVDIVYCSKTRDLSTGALTIIVLDANKCDDRNCVIIDDLCDGGGTFLGIASQIKPAYLTLIVTHGVFSKGMKVFEPMFNSIIVSDSYAQAYDSKIVNLVNIDYDTH